MSFWCTVIVFLGVIDKSKIQLPQVKCKKKMNTCYRVRTHTWENRFKSPMVVTLDSGLRF